MNTIFTLSSGWHVQALLGRANTAEHGLPKTVDHATRRSAIRMAPVIIAPKAMMSRKNAVIRRRFFKEVSGIRLQAGVEKGSPEVLSL